MFQFVLLFYKRRDIVILLLHAINIFVIKLIQGKVSMYVGKHCRHSKDIIFFPKNIKVWCKPGSWNAWYKKMLLKNLIIINKKKKNQKNIKNVWRFVKRCINFSKNHSLFVVIKTPVFKQLNFGKLQYAVYASVFLFHTVCSISNKLLKIVSV